MISVRNRRRPSSGNSTLVLLLCGVACLTTACGLFRPSAPARPATPPPRDITPEKPRVYNPQTGTYDPVKEGEVLVDTIHFTLDETIDPVKIPEKKPAVMKDVYRLAFLMPFDAANNRDYNDRTDPRLRRFIHYYAGARLGLQKLQAQGIRIDSRVLDIKESLGEAERLLQSLEDADAIIGLYERETLVLAADYAFAEQVPFFSPWTPSFILPYDNPYFIQLTPGLDAHGEAIIHYIASTYPGAKVYLVARNDSRERARLQSFYQGARSTRIPVALEELIIDDTSVGLGKTVLTPLLDRLRPTVFVLPYFSRTEEDFVNAFLRKLHADRRDREVYVFGMPQWLNFTRLNPDYLESTNVHVSTVHYMDPSDQDIHEFMRMFLEEYGTLPEPSAHQGYAMVQFIGEALHRYGTGFLEKVVDQAYPSADFDLRAVYRDPASEQRNPAGSYENRAVRMLRFIDHHYRIVR